MLYDDFEKELMSGAVQPNMRNNLVHTQPLQNIADDFLSDEQLQGRRVLEIGPGQCDFLDIAAARGAKTFGIDFDPCVARLGWHRGHSILTHNLQSGFPRIERKFDGVFCRASFNLYWFQSDLSKLRAFLAGIEAALHDQSWVWIIPWNMPGSGAALSPELEDAVTEWQRRLGIASFEPTPAQVSRYGISYAIPATRVWTRGVEATRDRVPAASASLAITSPASVGAASASSALAEPTNSSSSKASLPIRPSERTTEVQQPLPIEYLLDLFELFRKHEVELLTPDDLDFSGLDRSHPEAYSKSLVAEYSAWVAKRKRGVRPAVMLFHDCDAGPAETLELCEREAALGIRSTIALFARNRLKGQLQDYPFDFEALKPLVGPHKHCVTYHANTWEVAGYDENRVQEVFEEDLAQLKARGFDVSCISAHGGIPSPDARNNSHFFYPGMSKRPLVWTHNGFGLSGTRYSDGGFVARWTKPDAALDLRNYLLENLKTRKRLLILVHPQYYFARTRALVDRTAVAVPWIAEYWDLHDRGKSRDYWEPVARLLEESSPS